jgi:hypothetical protein
MYVLTIKFIILSSILNQINTTMKQFLLSALVFVLAFTSVSAQEYKKQLKTINKNLGQYYLDPVTNAASLSTALGELDKVLSADDAKADPLSWLSKGQIYNEIAKAEMIKKIADPAYKLATPDAGMIAFNAFKTAIDTPSKKPAIKDALLGILENEGYTNNIAITHFQGNDYNNAYKNFAASLEASDMLVKNKMETMFADPAKMKDQLFYTGACAYYGDNKDKATPLFQKLYDMGGAQPLVYEALFNMIVDKDEAKAMSILDAGRKANPDDSGLLFAEINYYLRVNKLDILVNKLKDAIAKEPNNVSVYTTLGNVYDQLNQAERKTGSTKADEYFNEAFSYYDQALKIDSKNFDATYSKGQLYYNKAASMVDSLNKLADDFSPAGTKKYNAYKAEMDALFDKALPFFLDAEKLDAKDMNTLVAIKEIYARSNKMTESSAYKAKIEALQGK